MSSVGWKLRRNDVLCDVIYICTDKAQLQDVTIAVGSLLWDPISGTAECRCDVLI